MKQPPIPQKFKDIVRESIQRHAWYIGVSHFTVDVHYMDSDKRKCGDIVLASMVTDLSYLTATMSIYPALIEKWKEAGASHVEDAIAHEIAHIATEKLYYIGTARYINDGEIEYAREELTTIVGKLSMELRQRNIELKKLTNLKKKSHDKKSRHPTVRKPAKSSVKHKGGKKVRPRLSV